jgi:hypothetical protein
MKIKCISCRFATVDESASDKHWTAYECGNPKSEYHKSLINISEDGNKHKRISWSGCQHGERKVKSNAKETTHTLSPSRLPGVDRGQVLSQAHAGIQPAVQPEGKTQVFQTALQQCSVAAAEEESSAGASPLCRV